MSFQFIHEPYELIEINVKSKKDADKSLDNAYLYAIYSYHQLLRFNLYAKHKHINDYRNDPSTSNRDIIVNDLHSILSSVYDKAEYVYKKDKIAKKYDCEQLFKGYNTEIFNKPFCKDKIFNRLIQAVFELYLTYISYSCKDYTTSLGFRAIFDETNSLLSVLLKNMRTGGKGGNKKKDIYNPHKEKALSYHDKFFTKKKDNGKWLYSNAKTAREIIEHFKNTHDPLNYELGTLENIIGEHRRNNYK